MNLRSNDKFVEHEGGTAYTVDYAKQNGLY